MPNQSPSTTPKAQDLLDQARKAITARKFTEAMALYDQVLSEAIEGKDRKTESSALRGKAAVYYFTSQYPKALEFYNQALPILQAIGDKNGEAQTLNSLGNVYSDFGQPQKAREFYSQALTIRRATGNKNGEADALNNLGNLDNGTGQPQKAVEFYNQALEIRRATGDKNGEAMTLSNLGNAYSNLGQLQKALENYNQALLLQQTIGDKPGEARALSQIGVVYAQTGQPQKALEFYNQALTLQRTLGAKRGEANTLGNMGIVYAETGQPQKALELYNQALVIFQEVGNQGGVANTLLIIGNIYSETGQHQEARSFYAKALPLQRATSNKDGEANTLSNLGGDYAETSEYQKALDFYNQALVIFHEVGDKSEEASTLSRIGAAYVRIGQPQKALDFYNRALPLQRTIGIKLGEARTINNIGDAHYVLGEPQKAIAFYQQALSIFQAIGKRAEEASTLSNLAKAEEKCKHPEQAEQHYARSIALYESIRGNLGGLTETKTSFLESNLSTYYHYLSLLLARGKASAAFELAQKTKARSLLDLMASGRVNLDSELTAQERTQENALRKEADRLNQQMVKEGVENEVGAKKRFAALKEQLKQTESQLQTFTDTLYARHPGLAQKRIAKTATLPDITKLLPADTALLDYIVLSQDTLALFVVTRSGVKALTLPTVYSQLVSKAATFRAACADPRKDYKPGAKELYKILIAPALKHLTAAKRLVVCPDGALWDVPFQALLTEGQFLAQCYEIAYAYSATGAQAALMAKGERKKPTQTLLILANPDFGSSKRFGDLDSIPGQRPITSPDRPIKSPDRPITSPDRTFVSVSRGGKIAALPGTQREADALKKLIPSATLLTGQAAQEEAAKAESGKYRYLHFATHGFFNDASPLLSSLVLAAPTPGYPLGASQAREQSEDGFLTAREIFALDLSAEMVVLSACNTARGVQRTGDGVVGLTWALFVAGCPTQVVSQWAVDDASTATLMTSFYSNLAKNKAAKGVALRQASLSLMGDPKHHHPYYWAPFVLLGDWR